MTTMKKEQRMKQRPANMGCSQCGLTLEFRSSFARSGVFGGGRKRCLLTQTGHTPSRYQQGEEKNIIFANYIISKMKHQNQIKTSKTLASVERESLVNNPSFNNGLRQKNGLEALFYYYFLLVHTILFMGMG